MSEAIGMKIVGRPGDITHLHPPAERIIAEGREEGVRKEGSSHEGPAKRPGREIEGKCPREREREKERERESSYINVALADRTG